MFQQAVKGVEGILKVKNPCFEGTKIPWNITNILPNNTAGITQEYLIFSNNSCENIKSCLNTLFI
jgi:hypothetical protein